MNLSVFRPALQPALQSARPLIPTAFRGAALLAALLAAPSAARAQFYVNDANIDFTTGFVVVGYASFSDQNAKNNPASPTVRIVNGGSVFLDATVYNASVFRVEGGNVNSRILAHDSSKAILSAGTAGNLYTYDTSTGSVLGGSFRYDVQAHGGSSLNFSGGVTGISGFGGDLNAYDTSIVNISGGTIDGALTAHDNAKINVTGGTNGGPGGLSVQSAPLVITSDLTAGDGSTITLGGGSILGSLYVTGGGTLRLMGSGLTDILTDPNAQGGLYSQYTLSGSLADGTSVAGKSLYLANGTTATFTLSNTVVPEPGSLALLVTLSASGAGIALRRRRKAVSQQTGNPQMRPAIHHKR